MKLNAKYGMQRIESAYDPEFDVSMCKLDPPVTWAEMYLKCALDDAFEVIGQLESRIEHLENALQAHLEK